MLHLSATKGYTARAGALERPLCTPCGRVVIFRSTCTLGSALQNSRARQSVVLAAAGESPLRTVISGAVSNIYKVSAALQGSEPGLSTLWTAIKKLNAGDVLAALGSGGDPNERNADGDTPLLYIARQGHYKYPPADIPTALIKGGADLNAKDTKGMTALQVSLLAGWQNIAELLIKSKASTSGVADIKGRLTCPDCKRIVATYNL